MVVDDVHLAAGAAEFAVGGPLDLAGEGEGHAADLEGVKEGRVEFAAQQQGAQGVEVGHGFDIFGQQHLEEAVVQLDVQGLPGPEAADTGGGTDQTQQHLVLDDLLSGLHADLDGTDLAQALDAIDKVGQPAEDPLVLLGRLIGDVGERAETRHVGEPSVVAQGADVDGVGRAGDDSPGGLHGVAAQAQGGGHIVDGAAGDIAQGRTAVQPHQAGDGLVERAVAAGADDQVVVFRLLGQIIRQVAPAQGGVDRHVVACLGKYRQHLHQVGAQLQLPCLGVDEKQHFTVQGHVPPCINLPDRPFRRLRCRLRRRRASPQSQSQSRGRIGGCGPAGRRGQS